jgi:hypothetical protein
MIRTYAIVVWFETSGGTSEFAAVTVLLQQPTGNLCADNGSACNGEVAWLHNSYPAIR